MMMYMYLMIEVLRTALCEDGIDVVIFRIIQNVLHYGIHFCFIFFLFCASNSILGFDIKIFVSHIKFKFSFQYYAVMAAYWFLFFSFYCSYSILMKTFFAGFHL